MKLNQRGMTLIELAVVLIIIGIVYAFAIPAVSGYRSTQMVKVTTDNIAGRLRLAREKAIGTGSTQVVRFQLNYQGTDYHVRDASGAITGAKLPRGITYLWSAGTQDTFRMLRDGRCLESGMVILQDARGVRDTVSVQQSGLVLKQ